LDHLSRGRLIFGAGLGFQPGDFTVFGEAADAQERAEKLDEGLDVVAGLWTGEPFSFHGKHYRVEDVTFLPRPAQTPRIPIWVAAGWPKRRPLRRAARWDGVYLMTYNQATGEFLRPDEVAAIAAYIAAHREHTGPFDIAVNVDTPPDPEQAAALADRYAQAGATWWIDLDRGSPEEYRARIRQGPPRRPRLQ
jgi:alkanesulfonate monooxygenase SsuD/methylene tetrahydromethanopterin reductase-like flavin-dependent oxidoreductase (luciferase family)